MMESLRVLRFSLRDFWEESLLLIVLNTLWSLAASLPFAPFMLLGSSRFTLSSALGLVLVLPLPVLSGGLCFVTNQIARGKAVSRGTFFEGLGRYWIKSLIVTLVNGAACVLVVANIRFYWAIVQGGWTNFAVALWILLALYWLMVQLYWFPMVLELESESLRLALRNAALMVLASPRFSLALCLYIVMIGMLCLVLTVPALVVWTAFVMLVANHATRSRLAYARQESYRPGQPPHS